MGHSWYDPRKLIRSLIREAEREIAKDAKGRPKEWRNPFRYDDSINYDNELPPGLRCFMERRREWLACPMYDEGMYDEWLACLMYDEGMDEIQVFLRFENVMRELKYTGRMYDVLACCDPLSQLFCVWLKFARNKGWHSLSSTGQEQVFRQFLSANLPNSSFTTEEMKHLLGIVFKNTHQ